MSRAMLVDAIDEACEKVEKAGEVQSDAVETATDADLGALVCEPSASACAAAQW